MNPEEVNNYFYVSGGFGKNSWLSVLVQKERIEDGVIYGKIVGTSGKIAIAMEDIKRVSKNLNGRQTLRLD